MDIELEEQADLDSNQELLAFFKALASATRLKLAGVLAQRPSTVEELAAVLDLSESTVSHHLGCLSQAGLVSAQAQGYYSLYHFEVGALHRMAERLLKGETLPILAGHLNLNAYDQTVLKNFLTRDGSLKAIPGQQRKYLAVLHYAVEKFARRKRYPEKEVNRILTRLHPDTASLRRGLVEYKLMQRANGQYWRA